MTTVRYVHNIDLSGNELLNAIVERVPGLPAPTTDRAGWIVFNDLDQRLYYCTGTAWELRATDTDLFGGQTPVYYLNRANHTGTMPATAVSGLDTALSAIPLNTLAVPTGPVDFGNQELTHVAQATVGTSAPSWQQVVDLVANQGFKHVRLGGTANVDLAATGAGSVIDGTALALNDLILLKDQTNAVQNGIYIVNATNLTRDPNSNTAQKLPSGTIVVIDQGTANADTMWMLTTPAGYVMGTNTITFSRFGVAPNPYTAGNGISIVSNVVSAVAASGITVGPAGIAVDYSIVARYWEVEVPAPSSGTEVNLTHNLGRAPVHVTCMELSSREQVMCGVRFPDNNNVVVDFAVAPVAGQYRVSVG
jgi:hypothetical protein